MNIAQLKQSSFLTKEDCGAGKLVTIAECVQENIAKEGAPQELKWCLYFNGVEKPMVLNSTNGQIIAQITGSPETDNWAGHQIVIYHDRNIQYAGKLVGGIRVRAPRTPAPAQAQPAQPRQAARAAAPTALPDEGPGGEDDSVPF